MGRKGSGVELREKSIRVGFKYGGEWCRETLDLEPTPANQKRAAALVQTIRRLIGAGTFEYSEFFPSSPRVAKRQAPARRTFGDVCRSYLDTIGGLKEATIDQYTNAVDNVWKPLLGADTPFDDLQHEHLAAKIGKHPWASAKSCNNYLIPLRGVFALIYRGQTAAANPLAGIGNRKVVKKKPDPLSPAERDRILADMKKRYDVRVWAYFAFQFFAGTRPEEAIALRWGDIDWGAGVARVQRVRTFRGSERDGSKTDEERDVDLTPPALAALKAMRPFTFLKAADADVFENPGTGEPWHDERSQRDTYWAPTLKRLGIRARRAYATRTTYCSSALAARVAPGYVAGQAGHSLEQLHRSYARWIPGADGGTERERLSAAFSGTDISLEKTRGKYGKTARDTKSVSAKEYSEPSIGRRDWTRTHSKKGA